MLGALLYVSCCTKPDSIVFAVNKLAKFPNNPGITHNHQAVLHLIGYITNTAHKQIKCFSNYKEYPIFKTLMENNIHINENTIVTFTDLFWNDCVDTGRSTGGHCTIVQVGPVDHSSHLPIPAAISSKSFTYIYL